MASPDINSGAQIQNPSFVFVKNGSLAIGFPGVTEVSVVKNVDVAEQTNATKLAKGDLPTYTKVTGSITFTGLTQDFLAWLHGYSTSNGHMANIIEDIDITSGAGAITAAAADDIAIAVFDANDLPLDMVASSPSLGQFAVSSTAVEVDSSVTDTYSAWYLTADTTSTDSIIGKFDFTATNPSVDEVWIGGNAVDPTSFAPYSGGTTHGLYLAKVVFHGELPIFKSGDEEDTYTINFTANRYATDDFKHYLVNDTASPTS